MIVVNAATEAEKKRKSMFLTARQLIIGLSREGVITEQEAIDAARTGALPAAFEAVVSTLPEADRISARITWAKMTTVPRTDPLIGLIGAASGKGASEIDAFFQTYSAI